MNLQWIGLLLMLGGAAWALYGPALKTVSLLDQDDEHKTDRPAGTESSQPIGSRVEAVAHCEAMMQYFESQDNKTGADCMRTAIGSIYAPKE
jgi:hypothetical protein